MKLLTLVAIAVQLAAVVSALPLNERDVDVNNLRRRIDYNIGKRPIPTDLTGPYKVYVDERAPEPKSDLVKRDGEIEERAGYTKAPQAPPVDGLTGRDGSKRDFSIDIPPKPVNQVDSNAYEGLPNGFKRPN
ncbi:UNVERIFIED_CONTAM: hypothetical protein HDU68_008799 [Siphonaria sp. JEL0065]|nr:hypothetical protein HDU68_008799 [Siphonaria sp. JEL0065]